MNRIRIDRKRLISKSHYSTDFTFKKHVSCFVVIIWKWSFNVKSDKLLLKKNVVRNSVQWVSEDHCSSGQYGVSSPMLPQWKFLYTGMNCRCIGLRKPFVTNGTLWTSWTSLYILKAWNKDDNIHVVVIYNTFNNLLAY